MHGQLFTNVALEAVKGRGRLMIELKYYGHDVDLESRVVGIVEEMDMASDVSVMSLKYDDWHRLDHEWGDSRLDEGVSIGAPLSC